jgi:chaperonin GroES
MNFRPLGNRVLVKQSEALSKIGSLLVPDTLQRKPLEGKVVACGPGLTTPEGNEIPMNLTVGDTVLITPGSATEILIDGAKYLILTEADILGIVD